MNKIFQNTLFYVVVFCITYFIYVYPFEIINELIFNEIANRRVSFYYTIIPMPVSRHAITAIRANTGFLDFHRK